MKSLLLAIVLVVSVSLQAQVTLTTSPYTENFNALGTTGLPTGFVVKRSASTTSLGIDTALSTVVTPSWKQFTRGFKNFASANGISDPGADSTTQAAVTDRALGVRQTSSTGWDQGTAFEFQIANTTGKYNFKLNFKLQSLDTSSPRTSTWIVDYGFGASPTSFTTVTSTPASLVTGNKVFSNTSVSIDFGSGLNDNAGPVWIRVWASTASTGSGNRASSAIDDWSLSWDNTSAVREIIRDENYIKVAGNLKSGLNVTFNKTIPGALKMQLVNMNGQVLWQKQMSKAIQGNVESVIPAKTVTSGVYMLTISSKEGTYTRKIAVQ